MLRTNSKQAKVNVLKYIETSRGYYESLYEYENAKKTDNNLSLLNGKEIAIGYTNGLCAFIYQVAKKEKEWSNHEMCQNLFTDWLQGLPSGGLGDFYVEPCKPLLASILEETEEEADRYTEEDAETLLAYLIYREVYNGFIEYLTHS